MADVKRDKATRSIIMDGPDDDMKLVRAEVREGLSKITEMDIEFVVEGAAGKDFALSGLVGERITLTVKPDPENNHNNPKYFSAHVIEVCFERVFEGEALFSARCRAWPWFLTEMADCRIYQEMSTIDIIKDVFSRSGFSGSTYIDESKLSGKGAEIRTFCVQYRETSWDFVYRLMVEDGITFYFRHENEKDILCFVGECGSLPDLSPKAWECHTEEDASANRGDYFFDWSEYNAAATSKTTLKDFDFVKPTVDLKVSKPLAYTGKFADILERYDYPGRYTEDKRGTDLADFRQLANAAGFVRYSGIGNVRSLATGHRITIGECARSALNREYFIIEAVHQLQIEASYDTGELSETLLSKNQAYPFAKENDEFSKQDREESGKSASNNGAVPKPYRVLCKAQPHPSEFKPPYPCNRPSISGLQTATVVGPSGREIYTDPYGRVKLQFHWDLVGKSDEKSSCWVRKAEPWTGAGWGMQWVPRIGQEVVVQFEEGDPDRPLVVGMLFNNAKTYPTFRGKDEAKATLTSQDAEGNSLKSALPANMTMVGWTTSSSKGGKTSKFHELVFEDKLNSEFVRFQSERDYRAIIKNNAKIDVGLVHKDKGDYELTIHNDRKVTVKEGDHTFLVEKGKEDYTVEKDRTVTMNANHIEKISKDQTSKIGGNQEVTVSKSQTIDVTQKISAKAGTKVTIKCGGSTIEMTPSKISLKSVQVVINGSAQSKVSGAVVDVAGSGMTKISGGVVKIN